MRENTVYRGMVTTLNYISYMNNAGVCTLVQNYEHGHPQKPHLSLYFYNQCFLLLYNLLYNLLNTLVILDLLDRKTTTLYKPACVSRRLCVCVLVLQDAGELCVVSLYLSLFSQAGNFTVRLDLPTVTFQLLKLDVWVVLV